jgi:phosphopantothenoylcysteine decarboxylase/phosphopantothenate--cysteine ligase
MKKKRGTFALKLMPTRDILASLPKRRPYLVVGFAAETHNVASHAQKKLRAKNCDAIVANDVSGSEIGMESNENEVTIFLRDGEIRKISRAPKKNIGRELVKIFAKMFEKGLTKKSW